MEHANDTVASQTQADPVVRWMAMVAGTLIVVLLGATLAFTLYLRSVQAPRTSLERDVERARARVEAQPQDQQAYLGLAAAYVAVERWDDALDAVDRAAQVGDGPEVLFMKADVLRAAGRYAEAIEYYDAAEPAAIEAYDQALVELRKKRVMEQPPNTLLARILFGRGLCYLEVGATTSAIEDLERAAEITPADAALRVALGDAYAADDRPGDARSAYEAALRFVPDYQDARDGLARLNPEED